MKKRCDLTSVKYLTKTVWNSKLIIFKSFLFQGSLVITSQFKIL